MKITILGASGFVGKALFSHLSKYYSKVTPLSRPEFDLTKPDTFYTIPPDTDILIHAAGYVGNSSQEEVIWKTNIQSTYYLIKYINQYCDLRRMIYLSSGAVYGMHPKAVNVASMTRPDGLYGVSKFLSEKMLLHTLKSRLVILRLFFPFGPGQHPPRLIPHLIELIYGDKPIEINTIFGAPIINPLFIDDLLDQIVRVMDCPEKTIYNLGGQENLSIRKIAEIIASQANREPRFIIKDVKINNLYCVPDLACTHNYSFAQLIAKTMFTSSDADLRQHVT